MYLALVTLAACLSRTIETNVEISVDATSLLQVSLQNKDRLKTSLLQVSRQVPQGPSSMAAPVLMMPQVPTGMEHWNGVCDVTFKDGQDCEPYTAADAYRKVSDWSWQSRLCKTRVPPLHISGPDSCLWQGCVANKNVKQGAEWYMQYKSNEADIPYCFREHCGNTQFTLEKTTLEDADAHCTKKFGDKWRSLLVGPHGLGSPGEGMGTGLWECAHSNYHCDWAYCKMYFCDQPELIAQWSNASSIVLAPMQ